MQVIYLNNVTGTGPYDVYVCDETITYCFFVESGVSTFPLTINLPPFLQGVRTVIVKVIDSNGCELFYNIPCLLPTPSVTITPSFTPTPTPTPTSNQQCFCIEFNNVGSGDNIGYEYKNCNGVLIIDVVPDGEIIQVCGSEPVSYNVKMSYTILGNCISGSCGPGI